MLRLGFLLAVGALAMAAPPAGAAGPCPHEWPFTQPARSVYKQVKVPRTATAATMSFYDALVVRPRELPPGVDRIPGAVLLHGRGGNKCALWWAARFLAAHGYETLTLTYPNADSPSELSAISAGAARDGVKFLRSKKNPYRSVVLRNDLALIGHSQGSLGASVAQFDTNAVRAVVGFDNLRAHGVADPGGIGCLPGPSEPVTPRVPGLGLGSETGCLDDPSLTDKLAGYHAWRAAGRPTMEFVLRGMQHGSFGGGAPYDSAHATGLRHAGYYTLAWLDRWLLGRVPAVRRLLSRMPLGIPIDQMLSGLGAQFLSAAFLPGRIDCEDLPTCL